MSTEEENEGIQQVLNEWSSSTHRPSGDPRGWLRPAQARENLNIVLEGRKSLLQMRKLRPQREVTGPVAGLGSVTSSHSWGQSFFLTHSCGSDIASEFKNSNNSQNKGMSKKLTPS